MLPIILGRYGDSNGNSTV